MDPKPQYARGTNNLQITARKLLSFTSQRITSDSSKVTIERVAALSLRVTQLMCDALDTKAMSELRDTRDTLDCALPIFQLYSLRAVVDYDNQKMVENSITQRSQTYENGKMQQHANFCRCLMLFLRALVPGNNTGATEASRAVVKAFYAGADRDKLQHAVMLLF